jgi:lipopolysaccharide transport system permease protein
MAVVAATWNGCWNSRQLSMGLFLRNVRGLTRQSFLGIGWILLPPLANIAIWLFLNQRVGSLDQGVEVNYVLYLTTGMILWQAFIDGFLMPLKVLQSQRALVTKIRFPYESLLISGLLEVLMNTAIRACLLVPLFWAYSRFPSALPDSISSAGSFAGTLTWLVADPLIALVGLVFIAVWGTAIGIFLAPLGALYQDIGRFISLATPFWMILTPIVYAPWREFPMAWLNWLNPASPLLMLTRSLLLEHQVDAVVPSVICALLAIPLLFVGLAVFRVSIPILVERIST